MKNYRKISISLILLSSSLFAQNELESSILSDNKNKTLKYSYEKNLEDNNKLVKDNIKPNIEYTYSYNDDETYETTYSKISVNQPIFKSGGIYNAIKYASNMEKYLETSNSIDQKETIKQALEILFEIKINELSIKKQELLIKNAQIDIQRKKEQVLNGILDASYLDNSILDANLKKNTLIDLKLQKQTLINNLSNLTDRNYDQITLPVFKLTENKKFKENNLYIKQAKQDVQNSYYLKNMAISQYLPSLNFTASYSKYHDTDSRPSLVLDDTPSNIGFNITIPLDISFNNNIQSNKIEYLKKKISLEDKIKEELSVYNNSIATIHSLEKKIEIAKNDVELYDSLLTQLQEQLSVGMSAPSDVQTMENSKKIKALDVKSLKIDIQLKLLDIYSRIES